MDQKCSIDVDVRLKHIKQYPLTYLVFLLCLPKQVFDSSGSFLSYINTSADPLYGPQGLALTSDGHVAVADSGNHCFKVYRYLQ